VSDDNVVPFPRPPSSESQGIVKFGDGLPKEGVLVTRCDDIVHVYGEVPGLCQCGERWWDGPPGDEEIVEYDLSVGQPWDEIFLQVDQNKAGLLMALAFIVGSIICSVAA
jgi:hypothetical protein